jgi:hypothetical protein
VSFGQTVKNLKDKVLACILEWILSSPLGPLALAVQNRHIASCAREFVIVNEHSEVLLFWRPAGVRYPECWHVSGTTVNKRKLWWQKRISPFQSVVQKYNLTKAKLVAPRYVDFVEIEHGDGSSQCEFGEVWTQIFFVKFLGGDVPTNARWFSFEDLPPETLPYHRTVLLKRVQKSLALLVPMSMSLT